MVITFLSDFGLQDDFVGTCHGVMKRIAPDAEIIDITHGIPPQQVLQGSLVLCNTLPYMPVGVHLAVVDPGVGSHRRPLALRTADGRLLVGPDNGLLLPAADALGGVAEAHELANPEYALDTVSRTFHGRDLFSPAAAHLSLGVPLDELGPPIDPQALVRLDVPAPEVGQNRIRAIVLYVDHFGNMQLNLKREHLEEAGVLPGVTVELELALDRYYATAARTFADARAGRHHPLRGLLRERRDRDQRRQRRGAVRRGCRARKSASTCARREAGRAGARSSAAGFARVTTNAVVARPGSGAVFRWSTAGAVRPARAESGTRCAGPRPSRALELALDALPAAPKRVLDLGTGTGLAAFVAARRFPEAEVVGVDLAPGMVEQARQQHAARAGRPGALRAGRRGRSSRSRTASFDLVAAREHDPVLRRARPGRPLRAGTSSSSFSAGPETPIWVPPERLRRELGAHGFTDFADFEAERRDGAPCPQGRSL